MKKISITSSFDVFDSMTELPEVVQKLMLQAIEARKVAYAPYSKFKVGAAILLENNEVVIGSNQENAAYPSGLCAERTAIFYAGAKYPNVAFKTLAISATSDANPTLAPIPPCGACRQSIAEYESRQSHPIEIYFMGESGKVYRSESLENLLPLSFDKNVL
ncbi:cytidine deaminase [Flavobacterium ardleyense]|uniref:cytidine deaminase n=1 Tax=Flavobacterium ardleyense TaxID=2038737 RepID=UPI00298C2100|nr:cytidine deaminase [Flavobacterium ardleyense]